MQSCNQMIQNFKKALLFSVTMILTCSAFAQVVKFRKVIGNSGYDYGYSCKQTFDKGYVIGGTTSTFGSGNTDMYIVKTDSMGVPYGQKTIGGINIDQGTCIRQTSDSGYVFLGYTNSYGAGGYDFYLVKMDSSFNIQWTKTYGGTDWDFGNCVAQTTDGGYILCGSTYSYGNGNLDYYLIKTNSLGDTLWTKTYGGSNEDEAKSVVQTSDGGYILTGTTKSLGDTLGDVYTIKTFSNGDTTWTKKFGGLQADKGNDVLESISGGYLVGGETASIGAGSSDALVIRLSLTGSLMNTFTIGNVNADNAASIAELPNGRIGIIGQTKNWGTVNGDMYFTIIRSDFSFFNSTTYGTLKVDNGFSVEGTADFCFILCGTTTGFNNFLEDVYLIKTDTMGLSGFTGSETTFLTSVQDQASFENNKFILFPNPANGNITLNLNSTLTKEQYEIIIIDVIGKEIAHVNSDSNNVSINTTDFPNGVYFLTLKNKDFISTQKLVIKH